MSWKRCSGYLAFAFTVTIVVATAAADPPRLSSGRPELHGVWTNRSLTTLERDPAFSSLVPTPAELREFAVRGARRPNTVWVDPGNQFAVVNGELRSSWIVDPASGRIPYNAAGRQRLASIERVREDFDNPEARSLSERCIAVGDRAGPPMVNGLANNFYRFIQTDDFVVIRVEMPSHARIIPTQGRHRPAALRPLFGDPVGRWEGDTLVVETTGFHPLHADNAIPALLSENGKVTERFTLISADHMLYAFEVEDPAFYTQSWRGEIDLRRVDQQIFEYACHEGDQSLAGILASRRAPAPSSRN